MQTPTLYALDTDVEVMLKTSSKLGEATNASDANTKISLRERRAGLVYFAHDLGRIDNWTGGGVLVADGWG